MVSSREMFRSRYLVAGSFSDVSDHEKTFRPRILGILAACEIVTDAPIEEDRIGFQFQTSRTHATHTELWAARGLDPTRPVASHVEFRGWGYGIGGSFVWDPEYKILRLFLLEHPQGNVHDADRDNRLTATLVASCGAVILDELQQGPLTEVTYSVSRDPAVSPAIMPTQPFVQHIPRLQPYIET